MGDGMQERWLHKHLEHRWRGVCEPTSSDRARELAADRSITSSPTNPLPPVRSAPGRLLSGLNFLNTPRLRYPLLAMKTDRIRMNITNIIIVFHIFG